MNRGEKKTWDDLGQILTFCLQLALLVAKLIAEKKEIKFDYKEGVQEIKKGGSFEYRFTKIANWN